MAFLLASTRCIAWLSIAPPFRAPSRRRSGPASGSRSASPSPRTCRRSPTSRPTTSARSSAAFLFQVGIGAGPGLRRLPRVPGGHGRRLDDRLLQRPDLVAAVQPHVRHVRRPDDPLLHDDRDAVLFVTGGHLLLVAGLRAQLRRRARGRAAHRPVGASSSPPTSATSCSPRCRSARPLLGALFVTELLLSLASRAAPQLNILVLGFGAKSLVLISVSTVAIPLLVVGRAAPHQRGRRGDVAAGPLREGPTDGEVRRQDRGADTEAQARLAPRRPGRPVARPRVVDPAADRHDAAARVDLAGGRAARSS